MDESLLAFQRGGLDCAAAAQSRFVKIGSVTLYGVRTKMVLDPGDIEVGGFKISRAFSLTVSKTDPKNISVMASFTPRRGQDGIDDQGAQVKVLRWDENLLSYTFYFGSRNK